LQNRNDKEDVIWELKNKNAEKNVSTMSYFSKRDKDSPLMFIAFREREDRPKPAEQEQKIDQEQKIKMEKERE